VDEEEGIMLLIVLAVANLTRRTIVEEVAVWFVVDVVLNHFCFFVKFGSTSYYHPRLFRFVVGRLHPQNGSFARKQNRTGILPLPGLCTSVFECESKI